MCVLLMYGSSGQFGLTTDELFMIIFLNFGLSKEYQGFKTQPFLFYMSCKSKLAHHAVYKQEASGQ